MITTVINPADHLRLAGKLAGPYLEKFPRLADDILAAGYLGLCLAARKYDGRAKFSTYAASWVRREVLEAIRNADTIRLPRGCDARRNPIALAAWEAAQRVKVLGSQDYDLTTLAHHKD